MPDLAQPHGSTVKLNNDYTMPLCGFGTAALHGWQTNTSQVSDTVTKALEFGYRHLDSAPVYGNETSIGRAIRQCEVDRTALYVTSKLGITDFGFDQALAACVRSLDKLELDYLDLYLLHWPMEKDLMASWRALERLVGDNRVRSIGVSNFEIRHLDKLLNEAVIAPVCNQIELHPFHSQPALRAYCQSMGIQVTSWGPLGTAQWRDIPDDARPINHPVISKLAVEYGVSNAQIILRWQLQNGVAPVVKSERHERMQQNLDIFSFSLTCDAIRSLEKLDQNRSFAPHIPGLAKT